MHGWRHGIAVSVVATLAVVALGALRPAEPAAAGAAPPSVTTPATIAVSTTTTRPATTTTTTLDRGSELEQMIGDMYYAWFDGVYRRDLRTIDGVAGIEAVLDWGTRAFDTVAFNAEPRRDAISVTVKNVLLDRPDCLVVSADIDYREFLGDTIHSTVDVYFRVGDGWGFAVKYKYEREMWQIDCDYMQRR